MTTEDFIARAVVKHKGKYMYNKTVFSGTANKVIVTCKDHGDFEQEANAHVNKVYGCPKCGKVEFSKQRKNKYDKKWFIEQSLEVHGDKYDYEKVVYQKNNVKVEIVCSLHGSFWQQPRSHLKGTGCPECAKSNNNYWSYSGWEKAGQESKYFDGYKVYVIKISNSNESFYKIGKTFNPLWLRFSRGQLPYNYTVIEIFEGSAEYMCRLEQRLLNFHTMNKYTPEKEFAGSGECFSSLMNGYKDMLDEN